ncbi:uncharacterized protein L201_004098 [Kwoniella dendrophila CBS 6074]|uniref:Uncharacterized protein n=1 Tax=Kwoniella dendrophila CBS 6074 TaxID=1295534 RepID=A0AAX4JX90_9TREE
MSEQELPEARKSTSTLLDGNHSFPPFYACYLLRSKATANSNRTYTSKHRPWEMQMIVYGKLTALQFEWAWQKPELSRHLRTYDPQSGEDSGPIFKKDIKRNLIERKLA